MSPANFCYVVGVIVVFASPALTIKCFQCSSYEHPECADVEANDTSSPFLHKCEPRDGHQMFCRKIVQSVLDAPNFTRITRTCGWFLHKQNVSNCQKTDTDFILQTNCQCFSDACNAAAPATPVGAALGVALLGCFLCAL